LNNDSALPEPAAGEGSSPPITLSDGFYFYDDVAHIAFVSEKVLSCIYAKDQI